MWVLVVFALNAQSAFSVPGYSSEQTCTAKGQEVVTMARGKKGGTWVFRCVKPE
jgi:Zn/Cd-binding protein ZinT